MSDRLPFSVRLNAQTWCAEGETWQHPTAGAWLLIQHGTTIAASIRFGERVLSISEPELRGFTWCNHAALVVPASGHEWLVDEKRYSVVNEWLVSEMRIRGHAHALLSRYDQRLYCAVDFSVTDYEKSRVMNADWLMREVEYGIAQYPFIVANALTGSRLVGGTATSMDCATHVTMASQNIYVFPDCLPSGVTPAHLAYYVGATPPAHLTSKAAA